MERGSLRRLALSQPKGMLQRTLAAPPALLDRPLRLAQGRLSGPLRGASGRGWRTFTPADVEAAGARMSRPATLSSCSSKRRGARPALATVCVKSHRPHPEAPFAKAKGLEGYSEGVCGADCASWIVPFAWLRAGFRGPFGAPQDEGGGLLKEALTSGPARAPSRSSRPQARSTSQASRWTTDGDRPLRGRGRSQSLDATGGIGS